MKSIGQTLSTSTLASSPASSPLPITAVEHLFDSLKGQLGAKVADMWGGVDPSIIESEWSAGLAGFRKLELRRGLDACSERIFAPTLGEFKNLCRPCLNPEFAWLEAHDGLRQREIGKMGEWTHSAVFFAAIAMSYEVRGGDFKRHRIRWTRTMQMELAKGWRAIPDPPPRLGVETKGGPPPDHVRADLARLRQEARRRSDADKQQKENDANA